MGKITKSNIFDVSCDIYICMYVCMYVCICIYVCILSGTQISM